MLKRLPLLVAQITDLHLFAAIDRQLLDLPTNDCLQTVLEQLAKLHPKPDLLLLTGDLSQDGSHKSYERLQDLLVPFEIPTYWLAGNHDRLPVMQQVLAHPPISSEKSFQAGGWHFLLLNSLVPGSVCGQLSQESLEWLDWQLQQQSDRPTLIGLHHPPCHVDSNWLDSSTLQNPADFFAIIDRHPQVALVCLVTSIRNLIISATKCVISDRLQLVFSLNLKVSTLRLTRLNRDLDFSLSSQTALMKLGLSG